MSRSGELVVEFGSMAAPTGKSTTPDFAASVVLSAGALEGGGKPPPPPPPPLGGGNEPSPPPPPQALSITISAALVAARNCLMVRSLVFRAPILPYMGSD